MHKNSFSCLSLDSDTDSDIENITSNNNTNKNSNKNTNKNSKNNTNTNKTDLNDDTNDDLNDDLNDDTNDDLNDDTNEDLNDDTNNTQQYNELSTKNITVKNTITTAVISNIIRYGIFVNVGCGFNGLIHNSSISKTFNTHIWDPNTIFTVGQKISVFIKNIDYTKKKIDMYIVNKTTNDQHLSSIIAFRLLKNLDNQKLENFKNFKYDDTLKHVSREILHNRIKVSKCSKLKYYVLDITYDNNNITSCKILEETYDKSGNDCIPIYDGTNECMDETIKCIDSINKKYTSSFALSLLSNLINTTIYNCVSSNDNYYFDVYFRLRATLTELAIQDKNIIYIADNYISMFISSHTSQFHICILLIILSVSNFSWIDISYPIINSSIKHTLIQLKLSNKTLYYNTINTGNISNIRITKNIYMIAQIILYNDCFNKYFGRKEKHTDIIECIRYFKGVPTIYFKKNIEKITNNLKSITSFIDIFTTITSPINNIYVSEWIKRIGANIENNNNISDFKYKKNIPPNFKILTSFVSVSQGESIYDNILE